MATFCVSGPPTLFGGSPPEYDWQVNLGFDGPPYGLSGWDYNPGRFSVVLLELDVYSPYLTVSISHPLLEQATSWTFWFQTPIGAPPPIPGRGGAWTLFFEGDPSESLYDCSLDVAGPLCPAS